MQVGRPVRQTQDGIGETFGGVGDRGKYAAADNGEGEQTQGSPAKLAEEMEQERPQPIG